MISPWKLIGWVFVGLLLVGGGIWWNRHKDSQYATDLAKWQVQKKTADSLVAVTMEQRDSALAVNAKSIPIYIQGRDRIIREVAGTSAEKPVQACFEIADTRISKCQATIKADSDAIRSLQHDLKVAQDKPVPQLPRFQFYGAVGYSARTDSSGTQMAPAFRAGIDSKLIGPIRLMTDAQLSLPGKSHSQAMWQANLFARVNF